MKILYNFTYTILSIGSKHIFYADLNPCFYSPESPMSSLRRKKNVYIKHHVWTVITELYQNEFAYPLASF